MPMTNFSDEDHKPTREELLQRLRYDASVIDGTQANRRADIPQWIRAWLDEIAVDIYRLIDEESKDLDGQTLGDLAKAQNVQPMSNVRALFGTWPGEPGDGFEESIDELRHAQSMSTQRGDTRLTTDDWNMLADHVYLSRGAIMYGRSECAALLDQLQPYIEDNIINDEYIDWAGVRKDVRDGGAVD